MKQLTVLCFLLSNFCTSFSQSTFTTTLEQSIFQRSVIYDVLYDEATDEIFTVGIKSQDADSLWLAKLNTSGDVIAEQMVYMENPVGLLGQTEEVELIKVSEGRYLTVGAVDFSPSTSFYLFFNEDLGDISIESQALTEGVGRIPYGIEIIDEDLVLAGITRTTSESYLYIQRVNDSIELVWEARIGEDNDKFDTYSSLVVNEGKIYVGYYTEPVPGSTSKRESRIAVLSMAGEILNDIALNIEEESFGMSEVTIVPDTNGERLSFSASKYLLGDNLRIVYYIADAGGNVIHSSEYGNELTNGNVLRFNKRVNQRFVAAGEYASFIANARLPVIGLYNRTADTLWTSTYDINNSDSYTESYKVSGHQVLEDGSILVSGNIDLFLPMSNTQIGRSPFVFKVDNRGCLEPDCRDLVNVAELDKESVAIYPNPINDYLTVYSPTSARLKVYGSIGQLISSKHLPQGYSQNDMRLLSTGVYFYEVLDQSGTIDSGQLIKR